jgi:hypothetical protein
MECKQPQLQQHQEEKTGNSIYQAGVKKKPATADRNRYQKEAGR